MLFSLKLFTKECCHPFLSGLCSNSKRHWATNSKCIFSKQLSVLSTKHCNYLGRSRATSI